MTDRFQPVRFPAYEHDHAPVRNINEIHEATSTLGDRVADRVAATIGSWPFVIVQSLVLLCWLTLNLLGWLRHWDPYPFILLNLMLSFQAAYTAPIIMMSENREATKDRLHAEHDFAINVKAEEEIKVIMERQEAQHRALMAILDRLDNRGGATDILGERREDNQDNEG